MESYEEKIDQICEEKEIEIDKKGYEKLEAKDNENHWKLLYSKLDDFSDSNEEDSTLEIRGIKVYCKKKNNELNEIKEKIKNEIRRDFIEITTGKNKDWDKGTEILVDYLKDNFYIYTTKNDRQNEVWIYKEGVYKPEGRSEIKEILRDLLEERYNIWIFNKVMNKLEPDTFIEEEEFFKQGHIEEVPVENGILNVVKQEIRPFNPQEIFFNKLPVNYNPEAKCPEIDKFLKEVLKTKNDKKVFYEMAGYCLLKEMRFEKAFIFVGDGRNGKDKSMELIKRLLSVENCASVTLHRLEEDNWSKFELFGKMANIAGEIGNRDLKNAKTFKACTGRSLISGERKYQSTISFVNFAKFIFACNELPMVYEHTRAFWDRWVLLEFPYTFVQKEELENSDNDENMKLRDENIIEKITTEEEMSGFLNKALEGLKRLLKNKCFSQTKGSKEIKDIWVRKANPFMAFCMDKLEQDPNKSITKKRIRKEFNKYQKKHRTKGAGDKQIKATLQDMFGVIEEYKTVSMTNTQQNVWTGIKWKKQGENED